MGDGENMREIKEELKKILSQKRYDHTIGVAEVAKKLAKI
jgi:HD superfamily phosphohydrolase YqeK